MLLKNNTAYLCDFGISNILDQSRGLTTALHGHVRWKATEQIIGDPETGAPLKANIRSDMYSFGSVFLEVRLCSRHSLFASTKVLTYNCTGLDR